MSEQPKKIRKKLLNKTLSAANKALEVAEDLVDMAQDTAKSVVDAASDTARNTLQFTADSAQTLVQLAGGGAKMTAQLASDTAKAASQLAQEAALQMAQNYFSKTTLTIAVSESQLNKQLRKMIESHDYIDFIKVDCERDRLIVSLDGHYQRLICTLSLYFDVLECKVSHQEQFLMLRHVNTNIDTQLRQARSLTNFALRRAARTTSFVLKRLPEKVDPVSFFLSRVDGFSQEGPYLWRVALHKNLLIELLQNRSWIVEKLLSLTDLSVIPGLSLLLDSEDMLLKLANQFEIRSLRVMPNRLDLLVGINT
ncbi:hypothetical protein [Agitococcus lubricus]|uniref:Uncharacterized protein n=1 Tax=Agitococcus lubricus TaxID=1077255 RepID=A0A2T5IWZ1_9GAMM|nr:hypothetical protein [Agitococcus lubricus]PTQ88370.1 hypothetical protein C8N29_11215 [Agitococcus lubricus]